MDRREFMKAAGAAGLFTVVTPHGITQTLSQGRVPALQDGFVRPPASARPHTWWHWMNGHVSAEGITADLEAMQRVGIGGFQNFFVGTGIPKGPVDYLSPAWLKLTQHAIAEASRLGLEFQMHNCPGWSSTGGPWITPELSMQQVVWSESFVRGGAVVKTRLAQPHTRLDHYRDIRVVAFPSLRGETEPWHENLRRLAVNGKDIDAAELLAGRAAGVPVSLANGRPGTVLLEFSLPFRAQAILLYARIQSGATGGASSVAPLTLEASDDGTEFRHIATITQVGGEIPGAGEFPAVSARYYRLQFPKGGRLYQIGLSGAARLPDWIAKANYGGPFSGTALSGEEPVPPGETIDPATIVDISRHMDADGNLAWPAPPGNWTILRFGHTSTARGNKSAPSTGEGLECDKYSKAAFDFHFHHMFDQLMPLLQTLGARGQVGLLIDSYEVGMQNWTAGFLGEFQKSRGYDLAAWLPVMTGRVLDSVDATERVLWDLRRVQADLMADHYYGRCAALCREHGFISYTEPYNNGPFEQMQAGSRMDVAMGEFWNRTLHFRHSVKLASSIQHTNGKSVVGAESFTSYPLYSKWQEYPFAMKAAGDYMYTLGLNRMVFHRFAHQPHPTAVPGMTMGPWGIHFDRTVTWWEQGKAWLGYLARCQYLLQQGLFVADLLYYTGAAGPGEDLSMRGAPDPAPPFGYDYDNVGTEPLLGRLSVQGGQIVLPDGMRYKVLVLPARTDITLEVLRKLHALVAAGMTLVGARPLRVEGRASDDAERQRLTRDLWGDADRIAAAGHPLGQGRVFDASPMQGILDRLGLAPDFGFTARSADPAIHYIHRHTGDAEMYFVANGKRRAEDLVCSFRVQDMQPEFWDPDTGTITPVDVYEAAQGRVRVPVSLGAAGSLFVVFRKRAPGASLRSVSLDGRLLFGTRDFPAQAPGRHAQVVNDFTVSAWIKPESDVALPNDPATADMLRRFGLRSFVFHPAAGEALYGADHAVAGLVAGRNGLAVVERSGAVHVPVLSLITPLSGWTHVALVYREGAPLLYVDGKLAGQGKPSGSKVHPALGEEFADESAPYFEGERIDGPLLTSAFSDERIHAIAAAGLPDPPLPPVLSPDNHAPSGWLFWSNGRYVFESGTGHSTTVDIKGAGAPQRVTGPWQLSFPPGQGAPSGVNLRELQSLHTHPDEGVKFFSGTVSYRKRFSLPGAAALPGQRIFLDLGRVEVIAEVIVNGKHLGVLWKPPFRVDITSAAKPGKNELEIRVTNLWPNRLIGDERQAAQGGDADAAYAPNGGIRTMPEWYVKGEPKPADGRVTFSTWKHYDKDAPLLASGLLGPVRLIAAVRRDIKT